MALTAERHTLQKDGLEVALPVAATTKIYAGALVCVNAAGYAVPGSEAATLTTMGMALQTVDNTGSAGAQSVVVRRGRAFAFANDTSDPVTQADVGKSCWIVDDETVSGEDDGRSPAGTVLSLEGGQVWVYIPAGERGPQGLPG